MIDLEDVRLARIAQRRFGVAPQRIARAFEDLDASADKNLVRILHHGGAIDTEQAAALLDLRERSRPCGLKLVSVLGKGASATVYKAKDDEGNHFAVKIMKAASERDFQRREHEVRALDRCKHEGIPRLIALGEAGERPFYVMDFVEGEPLSMLAAREGKLSWALVAQVGLAVARALGHVHERGMVHRDVKPSNVLVTRSGARLIDFGLSCSPGSAARGSAVGTPAYMAPELARGEGATPESDVYSFGAMLYFALSAEYPFQADSAHEMIALAADPSRPIKPLLLHREDLPGRLIALVERCLEKDPEKRPSCAEIVAGLERLGVRVASSSKVRALRRRRRRIVAA